MKGGMPQRPGMEGKILGLELCSCAEYKMMFDVYNDYSPGTGDTHWQVALL